MVFEERNYLILSVTEIDKIDFTQVLETSPETLRKSVDELKTFVKWDGDSVPEFVNALETKEGPYTYAEMLDILATDEWSKPTEMNV